MINIKKQKKKFLEDYFILCREHGFCIDWFYYDGFYKVIIDTPQYKEQITGQSWEDYKQELRESIK